MTLDSYTKFMTHGVNKESNTNIPMNILCIKSTFYIEKENLERVKHFIHSGCSLRRANCVYSLGLSWKTRWSF